MQNPRLAQDQKESLQNLRRHFIGLPKFRSRSFRHVLGDRAEHTTGGGRQLRIRRCSDVNKDFKAKAWTLKAKTQTFKAKDSTVKAKAKD
jgi:hypothetical protein